jgi:orotidine-5'-phosphate decarboxylase
MDQLLVALDVERAADAERLTEQLHGLAGGFKIGSRLFTAEGPQCVRRLTSRGIRVFLDLKFHDIPNTVAEAATEAARLGVWMMTVHASGGVAMMQAAMGAARDAATKMGTSRPLIVGITVLTSLNPGDLADIGVARDVRAQVAAMAVLALIASAGAEAQHSGHRDL